MRAWPKGLILIDSVMDSLLQQRRSIHKSDDIHRWGYQRHDHISSPPLFYTSNDSGSDMDLGDDSSRVFGSLFRENYWYVDGAEEAISSDEGSSQSNTYSDSASSCSAESEDYEGFRYSHYEGI